MLKQLGIATLYALLHYAGEVYFDGDAIVGYFEPASGLALAVLLLGGKRYAWGVLLGAALIHAISEDSLRETAIISLADTLQALCGAWLLTRDGKVDLRLQSLRGYLRLILLGGCASIAIGALAINTILLIAGALSTGGYFHGLLGWWMSDTLGVILITPLILVWWSERGHPREAGKTAETVLLLGLVILAGQAIFLDWWYDVIGQVAKGYWIFLIVTWAAVRLGIRETATVLAMTAIYALLGVIRGAGLFADDIAQSQLVNYWFYILTLSVVGMTLAIHFNERKQLEEMLRNRTDELVLHNRVLQQISTGASLCEVLEDLARQVEALHPGMLCSILLVAEDGQHLRHGAAPGLPDFYNHAMNGLAIGDGAGACGTAAYRGERVIVEDVQQHAYWPGPYRDLARRAGVQSCWSQPIKDGNGRVLGTFAIYHQKPAQPSDTEIAPIERYADLTALVIERIRIHDDLRLKDLALNAAANAIVITEKDSRIRWVNQAFSKLTGYELSEALGHFPKELVKSGKQSQSYYEQLWQTILSGKVWHGELINRRKNDSLYHEEMTITPVKNRQGEITHFVAVKQDVTERKQAEMALMRYKLIIGIVNDGFWLTDAAGNILETNAAYAKMSGYSVDELVNMHVSQLEVVERSMKEIEVHIEKVIAQGHERFETRHRHKDGNEIDVEVSATFMPESQQFIVFTHDITRRKQAEERIHALAFYDELTMLPNRRLLNDRVEQAMAASKRSGLFDALMFIDLDNFKPLNDTHGHDVGDLLLMEVAERITSCVREVDTVARFGGDEFVVVLRELGEDKAESAAQASIVAEKIRAILAEPYTLEFQQKDGTETTVEYHCTSSIGVVLLINHKASQEDILKWADMAMYQAKKNGRNRVHFYGS